MVFESIPARCLCLVAAREDEPGEDTGEVLYGAVELEGMSWMQRAGDRTCLVSAQIGSAVLEGLGHAWVKDELGCDGRHDVAQRGDERDAGAG